MRQLEWILVLLLPVLLVVLLVFEKRRQWRKAAFAAHLDRLEEEGKLDELDDELDRELEQEILEEEESVAQSVAAFAKGRPTRRLTAIGIYKIAHGIVAIGLIGFLLFMVFRSAVFDPVVRIVLLVTVGVIVFIFAIGAAIKRTKRERELLRPPH